MLIVFLPLWQIVTFLPYALSGGADRALGGADPTECGQGGEQADDHGGGACDARLFFLGLFNWAPFSNC